jgi:hypothetical protein
MPQYTAASCWICIALLSPAFREHTFPHQEMADSRAVDVTFRDEITI